MLSYRHAFHAGNHADVLKHLVLLELLDYFNRKDKPWYYVDTHAGGGCYALDSEQADKTAESVDGIGRLWGRDDLPPAVANYLAAVGQFNPHGRLLFYPGSPALAMTRARAQDRLRLFELHPADFDSLQRTYRVNVAGPTTLTAILNSLQMGFRTLAISRRASDVWKVLGAVKTEFGKLGDIVDATRKKLEAASKQFDQVDVRTRAIQRQLRQVEALPAVEAEQLLADGRDSEVLAEPQHLPPA